MIVRDALMLFLSSVLIVAFAGSVFAGAWTEERGHGLIILKSTYDRATVAFDDTGRANEPRDFRKIEGQFYAQWGLRDSVTLILAPTVQAVRDRTLTEDRHKTGLAYTELGARVRLWQSPRAVFSVQPLVVLPGTVGSSDNAVLGSGRTDFEMRALAGRNFTLFGRPAFVDVEGAFRTRGGRASDEWRADTAIGVTLGPRWQVMAQSFSVFGTDAYALHKGQVSLVQRWSASTSFEMGYWRALAGRNVVREDAAFAAIWFRL